MSENPERALALTYSPSPQARAALAALLMLDDRMAETVRSTSEPMLGQIRLKWWHDALIALDDGAPPAEPLLQTVASDVLTGGVRGARLAELPEAWSALLDAELDAATLDRFAMRGRALFELAGAVAVAASSDPLASAGEGWALADLAQGLSDAGETGLARARAKAALDAACGARWSRNSRALGAMAHLARLDLEGHPLGSPRRVARALWHRLSGR